MPIAGCGKKDDSITQAENKDVVERVAAPGIAETKAIAEEGFIYGLPIDELRGDLRRQTVRALCAFTMASTNNHTVPALQKYRRQLKMSPIANVPASALAASRPARYALLPLEYSPRV
jgi:hypothetical protein